MIGSATSERQRKTSLAHFDNSFNDQNLTPYSFAYNPGHDHGEKFPFVTRRENAECDSSSTSSDEHSRIVLNSIYNDRLKEVEQNSNNYDRRSPELVVTKKRCPERVRSLKVDEYQKSLMPLNQIASGYCYTRNLNPEEVLHIAVVKDAAAAIRSRVFITDDAKCTKPVLAAMKLQSFGVDKLIAGMTRIDSFSLLNDDLKAMLLKGAIAEMMLVRSSMHFDPRTKGWTIGAVDLPGNSDQTSITTDKVSQLSLMPCSSKQSSVQLLTPNASFHLSVELFRHIPGATQWVDDYFKFCELIDKSWKEDDVLITLLMVLILFNPENVEENQRNQIKEIK